MPKWTFQTGRGATKIEELALKGQTAAIAETTFATASGIPPALVDLTLKITHYIVCTVAGTSGQLTLRLRWTDTSETVQQADSATIMLNSVGEATSGVQFVGLPDGNAVTYEVIITGETGNPEYDLFLHAEQM